MSTTAAKPTLLVTAADLTPKALDMLGGFEVVFAGKQPTEDDIVALCARYKPVAIIVRYGKINARITDAAAGSPWVIPERDSSIDVINQDVAAARDIAVRAAVGVSATAVAEHAWALILACTESVPQLDARIRAGHWDKATHRSIGLNGRTLGLIGLSAIGRQTTAIGLAFGIRVLASDPYTKGAPTGVQLAALDELYTQSGMVSLHCLLTAENHKMLNRDAFSCSKPGAILVNTTRSGLISEAALVETLANGRLRAMRLDSFDVEPMTAPHPSQGIASIILSSHIGGVSDAAYLNMGKGAAANMPVVIEEHTRTTA